MEIRPGTTEMVYGWLVAAAGIEDPDMRAWVANLSDYGRQRAANHINAGRWRLKPFLRAGAAWTQIHEDRFHEELHHRCDPLPRLEDAGDERNEPLRAARVYAYSPGMRLHARNFTAGWAVKEVLRSPPYKQAQRRISIDDPAAVPWWEPHAAASEPEPSVDDRPDDNDVARMCAQLPREDAMLVMLRFAHPNWGWTELAAEISRQGVAITPRAASQRLSRLKKGEIAGNALSDADRVVLAAFQRSRRRREDIERERRVPSMTDREKVEELLNAVRSKDIIQWVAVVGKAAGRAPFELVQCLADRFGVRTWAGELVDKRNALVDALPLDYRPVLWAAAERVALGC
jgi:hypothetical protein